MIHIAVIGAWHNAHVTAACLAKFGHKVTLVNPTEIRWHGYPSLDIEEPGLPDLVDQMRNEGRLDYSNTWVIADYQWLAIDTPLTDDDTPIVGPLYAALDSAIAESEASSIIVSSQVPIGFCERVEQQLRRPVAYVPENMQLGRAIDGFLHAERLVVGASDPAMVQSVLHILDIVARTPDGRLASRPQYAICSLPTAEMIKHATNAMLATQISLANELAMVGEKYGADMQMVAKAMRMDSRIGPKAYVRPGLGFAGGTLPRDLRALQMSGKDTPVVDAVLRVNEDVVEHIAQTVVSMCPPAPRTVCIMGYTYKAETDTLRRSPVKQLVKRIREVGRASSLLRREPLSLGGWEQDRIWQDVNVVGYDPRFNGDNMKHLSELGSTGQFASTPPGHLPTWESVGRSMPIACDCGARYGDAGWKKLKIVGGGKLGETRNGKEIATGYVEFRACEKCPAHIKKTVMSGAAGAQGVDVFVVVTPLADFKKLDWSSCAPAVVYDLCNGVDRESVLAAGLTYKAIWQPSEKK